MAGILRRADSLARRGLRHSPRCELSARIGAPLLRRGAGSHLKGAGAVIRRKAYSNDAVDRWASLRSRFAVIAIAAALLAFGIARLRDIPVATLPDFGPPRVEIQTEALGLSAEEVENLITNPMEQEFFNGMPWLDKIRSDSITGLSSIELIFEPGTDPIRARQVVQERLTMTPALPLRGRS